MTYKCATMTQWFKMFLAIGFWCSDPECARALWVSQNVLWMQSGQCTQVTASKELDDNFITPYAKP